MPEANGISKARALQTLAVHGANQQHAENSAVSPIYQSSTFLSAGELGYENVRYTRSSNAPNQKALGATLAKLEGTEAAMVASSGMTAISTALLAFLSAGDHLIIQQGLYGGTYSLVTEWFPKMGITVTEIDSTDASGWEQCLTPKTKVLYCETICNPRTNIPDLDAVLQFAKRNKLVTMIDNTFASPAICRPAELGFDIVLESATKYLNGHNDVIAGVYAGSAKHVQQILHLHVHLGGCLDPHACFLLERGIRTLPLRVRQQSASAKALAAFLQQQPQVQEVHYAGLPDHADYKRCQRYLGGNAGGVFSFDLRGGSTAATKFVKALEIGLVAPSLGGVQTLISQPALTSHAGLSAEARQAVGILDGTIRVAVGIEDTDDLIADFKQAVAAASA